MIKRHIFQVIGAISFLFVVACSGGDSAPPSRTQPPSPPPPTGGGGPTWTQGVFESASQFKDRCEVVRTGVDIEGDPYPDVQGTELIEKFWLRSWTHETYLWNDEVVDRDPASIADRVDYFNVLKTDELTASGRPKDDFHFSEPTAEFLARRNAAPVATYGAEYGFFSFDPPRDIRILYTEPASPARVLQGGREKFVRGDRIVAIDGVDIINAPATQAEDNRIIDALFPPTAGLTYSFTLETADGMTRDISITSEDLSGTAVNRTRIINTATGDVGYMLVNTFSPFSSEVEIRDAIAGLSAQGANDVVLDLRYNGGGLLAVAAQLGYMVAGDARTSGKAFEWLAFNDDAGNINPVTGQVNEPIPFYSTGVGFSVPNGDPLPSLDLPRVYVLSTERTCSASESVINGLRGVDVEVVLIGDTTCGKPFGFYPTDNCGRTYYTIQFRGENDKRFGDYTDGFKPQNATSSFGVVVPGCSASDDLNNELGDENEGLLATALSYRANGTCPAPVATASADGATPNSTPGPLPPSLINRGRDIYATNRDLTLPE